VDSTCGPARDDKSRPGRFCSGSESAANEREKKRPRKKPDGSGCRKGKTAPIRVHAFYGAQSTPQDLGEEPSVCGTGTAHDYIVFLREKPYISYEFFEEKERGFSYEDFSVFSFLLGDLFNKGVRSVVI
jgi:hypothetical protein